MANGVYDAGLEDLLDGSVDWLTDDIKIVLVDVADYTVDLSSDLVLDDIPSGARVGTSGNLSGKAVTLGAMSAADVTVSGVSGDQFEAIVVYHDSGSDATSSLLAYLDTGVGFPLTPDGGDVLVSFDAGIVAEVGLTQRAILAFDDETAREASTPQDGTLGWQTDVSALYVFVEGDGWQAVGSGGGGGGGGGGGIVSFGQASKDSNSTVSGSSYMDMGVEVTLAADEGDLLMISGSWLWGGASEEVRMDAMTIVGGSDVSLVSGLSGSSGGISGWAVAFSALITGAVPVPYVVTVDDLDGDDVTIRLVARAPGGGSHTLIGDPALPIRLFVINYGPAAGVGGSGGGLFHEFTVWDGVGVSGPSTSSTSHVDIDSSNLPGLDLDLAIGDVVIMELTCTVGMASAGNVVGFDWLVDQPTLGDTNTRGAAWSSYMWEGGNNAIDVAPQHPVCTFTAAEAGTHTFTPQWRTNGVNVKILLESNANGGTYWGPVTHHVTNVSGRYGG